jgi:hypothetical protein
MAPIADNYQFKRCLAGTPHLGRLRYSGIAVYENAEFFKPSTEN